MPTASLNIDWRAFKREGDAYLRRMGLSDDDAIVAVASLFLREYYPFRIGKKWNPARHRWERPGVVHGSHRPALGIKKTAEHRANLAASYAAARGTDVKWTPDLERTLLQLRSDGLSYTQIARHMGKNKASIQARVRYLQLGRRLHKTPLPPPANLGE